MDGLCLKPGIHGISPAAICGGIDARANPPQVSAVAKKTTSFSRFSFRYPLRSFWPEKGRGGGRYGGMALDDAVLVEEENGSDVAAAVAEEEEEERENWILKILHVRSPWGSSGGESAENEDCGGDGGCSVDGEFDRDSFSRLLRRVSLAEAKLYAQMSYLGNIAYCIPKIQAEKLLRCYNLRYVTSSIDKRESAAKAETSQESAEIQDVVGDQREEAETPLSTASYLHSHAKSIPLPFSYSKDGSFEDLPLERGSGNDGIRILNSDMASLMASTDSVTSVVTAKEEVKQAVADDLNSTHSSPCEWFVSDDDESGTRFFAIQGSETIASWQANLLFEPVQFEGLDVIVHRGIYEAAKGMYEQMLPEVRAHLKSRGNRPAAFRFTGHSLGGSLALLVNLMLPIRNEVPVSSLLPVITFGSPSIMCGGDHLLRKLGLPRSHVKAITMHRDIVPRAFSCHYPNHVAEFLKAVNGNFRNLPCLNTQNLLYAPMGEFLILQPDEKFSPSHDLLPAGIGLYVLSVSDTDNDSDKRLRAAKAFLNSPHPLEILRDRSAYGPEGAVQRDHDMNSYLKCLRGFIRQELNRVRKTKREHRRKAWWPLVAPRGVKAGVVVGRPVVSTDQSNNFSGIVRTGRDSLRRFSRLVASQHMHLLVVLLFPARLLLLGAYGVVSLH